MVSSQPDNEDYHHKGGKHLQWTLWKGRSLHHREVIDDWGDAVFNLIWILLHQYVQIIYFYMLKINFEMMFVVRTSTK